MLEGKMLESGREARGSRLRSVVAESGDGKFVEVEGLIIDLVKDGRVVGFVNAVELFSSSMVIALGLPSGFWTVAYSWNLETVKEAEYAVGGVEVVVNDVDEVPILHHAVDDLAARAQRAVALGPVRSKAEGFVFPSQKTDRFDDGRLYDLFPWEDAPCHGIGTISRGIGS